VLALGHTVLQIKGLLRVDCHAPAVEETPAVGRVNAIDGDCFASSAIGSCFVDTCKGQGGEFVAPERADDHRLSPDRRARTVGSTLAMVLEYQYSRPSRVDYHWLAEGNRVKKKFSAQQMASIRQTLCDERIVDLELPRLMQPEQFRRIAVRAELCQTGAS